METKQRSSGGSTTLNYFSLSCSCMTPLRVNIKLSLINYLTRMQNKTMTPDPHYPTFAVIFNIFVGSIFIEHHQHSTWFTATSVGPTCEASMRKSWRHWDVGIATIPVEDIGCPNPIHSRVILPSTTNILGRYIMVYYKLIMVYNMKNLLIGTWVGGFMVPLLPPRQAESSLDFEM